MTPAQIVRAIKTPLEEANSKLCAYSQGIRMLLLDSEFWLDVLDVSEAMEGITKDEYPCIDRLYLLNVNHRGNLFRIW